MLRRYCSFVYSASISIRLMNENQIKLELWQVGRCHRFFKVVKAVLVFNFQYDELNHGYMKFNYLIE